VTEMRNTVPDIWRYFQLTPGLPLREKEFSTFWQSLTDKEKTEYLSMELPPR
jgi:hypothetical protein